MILEVLFGLIYMLWGAVAVWSLSQLNGFLAETPRIADAGCLERFKSVVRIQMFLALAAIVVLGSGMIVGLGLIARHGLLGLAVVIGTNTVLLVFSLYLRRIELRTRNLEAASEALGSEYRRVCETWVKKALPDF